MNINARAELESIYSALDNEVKSHNNVCNACGSCCDFGKFDHILFASIPEVEYIVASVVIPENDLVPGQCPFHDGKTCSIHKSRTLGCRVFYCNQGYKKDYAPDIYEKYYRKIKDLAFRYEIDWEYKPFLESISDYLIKGKLK